MVDKYYARFTVASFMGLESSSYRVPTYEEVMKFTHPELIAEANEVSPQGTIGGITFDCCEPEDLKNYIIVSRQLKPSSK